MIVELASFITWKELTGLIQVIIWPITVLVGLLFFRKHLGSVISSLGTIKAGASGLEMTFQNKLDSVKDMIGLPENASGGTSKSSGKLNMNTNSSGSPYQQLMELRDVLNSKIVNRAKELNLSTDNSSSLALIDELNRVGGITFKKMNEFKALIDLTNSADQNLNQNQLNQIKNLVLNLNI